MKKLALFLLLFQPFLITAQQVVNNSLIAFTIAEKDLLSESISYDPITRNFYVSSTRKGKILQRFPDGKTSDFATTEDGLWMTIGSKVDAKRRHLWVCSSGGANLIGFNRKGSNPAGIFKFDLESGELLFKYIIDEPDETHFFNDIVITKNGDVFATHMFEKAAIYKIDDETEEVTLISQEKTMRYPNGLTLSDDEKYLFIAHSGGIGRIEIDTRDWINLTSDESIKGNDGLYFYNNSLIGILQDQRAVVRYYLDDTMEEITQVDLLEKNHPMMILPTTGVLIGKQLYYIANAQFDSFNESGSLFPMDQLYELVILKLTLKD